MLSRLAARAAAGPSSQWLFRPVRVVSVRPITTTAAKENKDDPNSIFYTGPERDLVNFPRRTRPIDRPAVRFGFIPEEFFQMFHAKTGVSGPYVFLGTVTTYLLSKEIWVLEHDFYCGIALLIVFAGIADKVGPGINKFIYDGITKKENELKAVRQDEIDRCKAAIDDENNAQWMATSWETLIQAKKDNVGLQLEAEYRQRLQEAYNQVKRRLDYQLETTNVMRRIEQKHMVDWIISSVKTSITPKLEEDALKKCVTDLKGLSMAAK